MTDSVVLWILLAVLVFWSVGAYNRLMRLRFQAAAAFGVLEHCLRQYVVIVQENFSVVDAHLFNNSAMQGHDTPYAAGVRLAAAAGQFSASLSIARATPLDGPAMSALRTAHETLCLSWARLRDLPHDLAGQVLSPTLQTQWDHVSAQIDMADGEFSRLVAAYNTGIGQFPALLMAAVLGLKRAQPLLQR